MQLLLSILIIGILSMLAFQDFKSRAISWILIPFLFVLFGLKSLLQTGMNDTLQILVINLLFIGVQMFLLTLWMSIKNRRWISVFDSYLGWGDVLFFVAIALAFNPIEYVLFYVISIAITLTVSVFYLAYSKKVSKQIPLAGAMATVLIGWMLATMLFPSFQEFPKVLISSINL